MADNLKKVYVVDTSALIDSPNCLTRLSEGGNICVVPQIVLEEIDNLSKRGGEIGVPARAARDALAQYHESGSFNRGLENVLNEGYNPITLRNKGILVWENKYRVDEKVFPTSKADNIILGCCLYARETCPEERYKVTLITEDITLMMKAGSCKSVSAERLIMGKAHLQSLDDVYEGVVTIYVRPALIDEFLKSDNGGRSIEAKKIRKQAPHLAPNEGVMLIDEKDNNRVIPTRFDYHSRTLKELVRGTVWEQEAGVYRPRKLLGINPHPNDFRQALFIDLVLDPTIKVIFAYGSAGTGKTSCASAAAVYHCYMEQNVAFKDGILIMRPEYSSGHSEVASFPGGPDAKNAPWVKPIMDKLLEQKKHAVGATKEKKDFGRLVKSASCSLLRGSDLKDNFVIIDEFQNADRWLAKTALTRVNSSGKCIILGDLSQIDNKYLNWRNSGLALAIEFMKNKHMESIGVVKLTHSYRGAFASLMTGLDNFAV